MRKAQIKRGLTQWEGGLALPLPMLKDKPKGWGRLLVLLWLWGCGGGSSEPSLFGSMEAREGKKALEAWLEVAPKKNWKSAKDSVLRWLEAAKGTLLELEVQEHRIQVQARVPVSQAEVFFTRVRNLGLVLSEYTALTDITRQYTDIEARLASKDTAVSRLKALLAQARTPSEVLEAEKALQQALEARDELRTQFENARLLSQTVIARVSLRDPTTVEYNEGGSYTHQLLKSIEAGWTGFVYFTFAVAYLWWLWLLVGGVILGRRWIKRRRRHRGASQASGGAAT